MYDIVIIGAGPSGSTLARLLSNKYKILIIDQRNLNSNSQFIKKKACGGLVSPDAQRILAEFNLSIPKDILVDPQIFSVRVIDQDNQLERFYQRHYLNIDREKFDRWLVSLIPTSVDTIFESHFKGYEIQNNHILVSYTTNHQTKSVETRYLVGADGGSSILRNLLIPFEKIEKYISIQEWYHQDNSLNYYTSVFDKRITDYYSWTISKENSLLIGTAIKSKAKIDYQQRFEILKEVLKKNGLSFSTRSKKEGSVIIRPLSKKSVFLGIKDIYLVGEAAGFISPTSAEGYSYAMKSAYDLALSFDTKNIRKAYQHRTRKLRTNLFFKKVKLPFMYHKLLRAIILKTGLFSIKIMKESKDARNI